MSDLESESVMVSRGELAAKAAAREQRNRPRGVLYLGVLVVLAGLVYLMVGRSVLASAKADRQREVATATNVRIQADRLDRHILSAEQDGAGKLDPFPNFTTAATSAAQSQGLTPAPTLSSQRQVDQGEVVEQVYQYDRVTSRDLEALIGWVAQVQKMVPGVEISQMNLAPQRTQWQLSITFVKPELAS
ncbi:MAG: hypothetical protein ACIAS6_02750 [Phycisphaerales bacterium JB060]